MKLILITLVAVVVGMMVGCGGGTSSDNAMLSEDEALQLVKDHLERTTTMKSGYSLQAQAWGFCPPPRLATPPAVHRRKLILCYVRMRTV